MKLKNVLITVSDIEESKRFYHDLFGLDVILDTDGKISWTEGLVLQDINIWKEALNGDVILQNNASELYFEETNIENFVDNLKQKYPNIKFVNELTTLNWGQKMVRFYDLDGNLIEVRTPM